MEVCNENEFVLNTENPSGLLIKLHPLVLINISDHFTREKIQNSSSNTKVIGALLGIQKGREVEIYNSFELPYETSNENIQIDDSFFSIKQAQFKQVFPTYEFMGWYSTGYTPTKYDILCQQQFLKYNESSLFLQLNPSNIIAKSLPIKIYESIIEVNSGKSEMYFIQTQYKIVSREEERISIDHINNTTQSGQSKHSQLLSQLTSQKNAIKMLYDRIKVLYQYISDVDEGKIKPDHDILREIVSLCVRLPTVDSQEFKNEFMIDCNDIILISYLSVITKGTNKVNQLIDNFNNIKNEVKTPMIHY